MFLRTRGGRVTAHARTPSLPIDHDQRKEEGGEGMATTMAARGLDIVVLGATGFTGMHVCQHIARLNLESARIKWGVAGRSDERIKSVVLDKLQAQGLPAPSATFLVDIKDANSVEAALSSAKLVLNCTGPYRFLGEPVVAAAIKTKTDYIDLCGEPEFMQRMYLEYHQSAQEAGVLVINACAFDSIPADLGALFTAKCFSDKGLVCSAIDSFLTLKAGPAGVCGHATTYECAVHGFGAVDDLRRIRKQIKEKYPPPELPRVGSQPPHREGPFSAPAELGKLCTEGNRLVAFKFPGADASVVRSTQETIARRGQKEYVSPFYSAFVAVPTWPAVMFGLFGSVFSLMTKSAWGRRTLLKYPEAFTNGIFSHEGPNEEQLAQSSFQMTFFGKGYKQGAVGDASPSSPPDATVICQCSGPEAGYVATPLIFVAVAQTLLEERGSLPEQGGVLTPGAAFGLEVGLLNRLNEAGVRFEELPQ
jgi:short subunit dehydrogenase-like uncharacterized protein